MSRISSARLAETSNPVFVELATMRKLRSFPKRKDLQQIEDIDVLFYISGVAIAKCVSAKNSLLATCGGVEGVMRSMTRLFRKQGRPIEGSRYVESVPDYVARVVGEVDRMQAKWLQLRSEWALGRLRGIGERAVPSKHEHFWIFYFFKEWFKEIVR